VAPRSSSKNDGYWSQLDKAAGKRRAVYWIAAVMLALCQGGRPGDAGAFVQQGVDPGSDASELVRALERAIPQPLLPERNVLELALRAYGRARIEHRIRHPRLTVIDYSLPSTAKRLWVVDLEKQKVLFHEWVAHGRNSGANEANSFSNAPGTHMSSLGLFLTGETYVGGHGYSLRLDGLEAGRNDRARARDIVVHGASYVSPEFAAHHGRLGRSWGCPALRPAVARPIIDAIKDGGALFAYYPNRELTKCEKTQNNQDELSPQKSEDSE
jgi:hypothetical protein